MKTSTFTGDIKRCEIYDIWVIIELIIIYFQDNKTLPNEELYAERKILRWETEITLAHFDREVNAFEEGILSESNISDSEDQSLCLDDSSNESVLSSEVRTQYV